MSDLAWSFVVAAVLLGLASASHAQSYKGVTYFGFFSQNEPTNVAPPINPATLFDSSEINSFILSYDKQGSIDWYGQRGVKIIAANLFDQPNLKRLLFATEGRGHQTVLDFAADLLAHGGDPQQIEHVCQDMSAAYAKGVGLALPQAAISDDRFHVVAMAMDAMDEVRRAELRDEPQAVQAALGDAERQTLKGLMWNLRKNPSGWNVGQLDAMCWL